MKKIIKSTTVFLIGVLAVSIVVFGRSSKPGKCNGEWAEATAGDNTCCFKNYSGPEYFLITKSSFTSKK